VAIVWHLMTKPTVPGKAESLERLDGKFRWPFRGGVATAGTILPMVLAVVGVASPRARDVVCVVCLLCTVAGGFALRLITLRVGFFPPVTGAIRLPKR
jgi:formate-dependent nitrite reductase membrane component NrfD